MRKRACSRAKSSLSVGTSMTPAKLSKASLCFMTIQPSLPARWTKPRWHFARRVTPKKQTAFRASCANVIRITPAGEQARTAWGAATTEAPRWQPSLLWNNRDAPGADAVLCAIYIDNRDIVWRAILGKTLTVDVGCRMSDVRFMHPHDKLFIPGP